MDAKHILRYDIMRYVELIVLGKSVEVNEGWKKLKKLESEPIYKGINNYECILRETLSGPISNVHEVPSVMDWFAKYLVVNQNYVNPISDNVAAMLRNTKINNMSHLTMILQTLLQHDVYLPDVANHSKLCEAVVLCLSTFQMSSDPKKVSELNDNAVKVQKFLQVLLMKSKNSEIDNLRLICLQTLYTIISDTKRKLDPGPWLAVILELVDELFIPKAVAWILSESQCTDSQLAQALKVLCNWVHAWNGKQLSFWIMEFIYALEKQHKYSILMKVTQATLNKMLLPLVLPVFRQNVSPIFFHILKRQGSPCLAKQIIESTPMMINALMKEDSESSKECIQNLVNVTKMLMLRFPNECADSNLESKFPMQPQMHLVNRACIKPVWKVETEERDLITELTRSQSGKVGLSNLGNTCYMNSVLQALLMSRQFCYEILTYKPSSNMVDQDVLKKLQNLFALLLYSKRISLAPTEILLASRPHYFLPGHQQDSSEFLCYLLDLLHEQEKSAIMNGENNDTNTKYDDNKEMNSVPSISEDGGTIKRSTTEEDITESIGLERKTQSLADFTEGEDLADIQQLSDSHSDSTDSGIQSVGGEDTSMPVPLVHRVLGGKCKTTYQCAQCATSSHNTDKFRDLQLGFPEEIQENQEISVQDLINYYLTPEKLTGENKYRCDKCMKLCDAQRIIKILHAPTYLILILKHFRYQLDARFRTKLSHKVMYNEIIQLPVTTPVCSTTETYELYASVVHSGYNMDYGHYFTYARDSKQNWYKFNDNCVTRATFNDFKELKPPDTPYILFYEKSVPLEGLDDDKPELSTLSKELQEFIQNDTVSYIEKLRRQDEKSQFGRQNSIAMRKNENSDDENPPPSSCRDTLNMPASRSFY